MRLSMLIQEALSKKEVIDTDMLKIYNAYHDNGFTQDSADQLLGKGLLKYYLAQKLIEKASIAGDKRVFYRLTKSAVNRAKSVSGGEVKGIQSIDDLFSSVVAHEEKGKDSKWREVVHDLLSNIKSIPGELRHYFVMLEYFGAARGFMNEVAFEKRAAEIKDKYEGLEQRYAACLGVKPQYRQLPSMSMYNVYVHRLLERIIGDFEKKIKAISLYRKDMIGFVSVKKKTVGMSQDEARCIVELFERTAWFVGRLQELMDLLKDFLTKRMWAVLGDGSVKKPQKVEKEKPKEIRVYKNVSGVDKGKFKEYVLALSPPRYVEFDGKLIGSDFYLYWNRSGWYVVEQPKKGVRKVRAAYAPNHFAAMKYEFLMPENVLGFSGIKKTDSYEQIKSKIDDAVAYGYDNDDRDIPSWGRDIKWMEGSYSKSKIDPSDNEVINVEVAGEKCRFAWNEFSIMNRESRTQIISSSSASARKIYKMLKANPFVLKGIKSMSSVYKFFDKNGIKYKVIFHQYV